MNNYLIRFNSFYRRPLLNKKNVDTAYAITFITMRIFKACRKNKKNCLSVLKLILERVENKKTKNFIVQNIKNINRASE